MLCGQLWYNMLAMLCAWHSVQLLLAKLSIWRVFAIDTLRSLLYNQAIPHTQKCVPTSKQLEVFIDLQAMEAFLYDN